jgi:two-component system sensor histidine kinase FlrB
LATASLKREQLQTAFELFNEHSGRLERSYRELRERVETLTTELKLAQSARLAELIEKEKLSQHLSQLLESLPGGIVVLDAGGKVRESNTAAVNLLNRPLVGCAWATVVRREVRKRGSEDGNFQLRDGRWLSLSRRPLGGNDGEVLLLADITESRQMAALRQRQERLTAIGEMTAKFAHDVRTPLASAMLYAAQLDDSSPGQRRVVQKITARLSDLGRMVNDMLGFAAGSRAAEEPVDLRDLLADVAATVEPQLAAGLTLTTVIDDGRPMVAGNRDALRGAVLNLVNNAVQACRDGGTIRVTGHASAGNVVLEVSDDGPGIAADALPRLFEPFFTTRPQGTGLGLAVVRAVVKAHGGSIAVASVPGATRFTLTLPAMAPADGGRQP